jgi:hypothetical protein
MKQMEVDGMKELMDNMIVQGIDKHRAEFSVMSVLAAYWKDERYRQPGRILSMKETILYMITNIYNGYNLIMPSDIVNRILENIHES